MQQVGFLLPNLLLAQHVSGTIMPIIRSSRFIQMVAACDTWRFGLQVVGLVWSCVLCVRFAGCCCWSGVELWVMCPVCGMLLLVWCGVVGYVSGLQDAAIGLVWSCGLCVRFAGCCYWSGVELWVMCPVCGMLLLVWCGVVGYVSGFRDATVGLV